jgi:hypothetical protein
VVEPQLQQFVYKDGKTEIMYGFRQSPTVDGDFALVKDGKPIYVIKSSETANPMTLFPLHPYNGEVLK